MCLLIERICNSKSLKLPPFELEEPPILLNPTSFWHRFCFDLLRLCMITITQKIKIMADVVHHMFTKSVFYTPPLTEKNTIEFPVSTVLMMIRLN